MSSGLLWMRVYHEQSLKQMHEAIAATVPRQIHSGQWLAGEVCLWHSCHVLAVLFYNWCGDRGTALSVSGKPGEANEKQQHRADLPQESSCSLCDFTHPLHFHCKKTSQNQNKVLCPWRQSPVQVTVYVTGDIHYFVGRMVLVSPQKYAI